MNRILSLIALGIAILLGTGLPMQITENLPIGGSAKSVSLSSTSGECETCLSDPDASATEWARQLANELSAIDPAADDQRLKLQFGSRTFNPESEEYEIWWGGRPNNVVKVVMVDRNSDATPLQPAVPVVFTGVFSTDGSLLRGEATAYLDAPDLMDFIDQPAPQQSPREVVQP